MRYGVPALLSLIVPGLGQLIKRHTRLAVTVWIFYVVGVAGGWMNLSAARRVSENSFYPDYALIPLVAAIVLATFALVTWIWSVVDAYNRPAS